MAGLGVLIVAYAVLGPLLLDVIHFRTSASGIAQIRGGDLAALIVVAPSCFAVARLARRGHAAAPVLALAPAMFAMYTYSQLVLGNEYLTRPGNVERYFPLLLAIFVLASGLTLHAWRLVPAGELPRLTPRMQRGSGWLLVLIAAFVVLGLHLPSLLGALRDPPTGAAYLATPNTFWVVKLYDLGVVAPAALVVGVGLLRDRPWAHRPAYAILGGYVLLASSVAGMAWSMLLRGDPDGSVVLAGALTALVGLAGGFAYVLYRPLFGTSAAVGSGPTGATPAPEAGGAVDPDEPAGRPGPGRTLSRPGAVARAGGIGKRRRRARET